MKKPRTWIFSAYKNGEKDPFFTKEFTDHTKLKIFSAEHSAKEKTKDNHYISKYTG